MNEADSKQLDWFEKMLGACEGRVKFADLSAIAHIRKAWELKDSDMHMAVFRSICAEEETATSLMASIKAQGYPESEKLHFYNHASKAGVIVFIKGVLDWVGDKFKREGFPFHLPIIKLTNDPGRPAMEIVLPLKAHGFAVHPRPPLHLITQGQQTLQEMIGDIVRVRLEKKYIQEVHGVIKQRANLRNKLLYASDDAVFVEIKSCDAHLLNQLGIVCALLSAVALVDPWRKPNYPLSGIVESAVLELVRVMTFKK